MSYYQHAFTGPLVIHRVGHYRYRVVFLPPELAAALPFDRHPRLRMEGEVADVPIQGAWQPAGAGGQGGKYLMVSPAILRAAGVAVGDLVDVRFNLVAQDAVTVPEELTEALAADARARATWEALTPGRRRGLAALVGSARTEATRARRAAALATELAEGRSGPTPGRKRPARSAAADPAEGAD